MSSTDRTTDQIAHDIKEWGANDADADALGKILVQVLRATDEGKSAAEIRDVIDDATAD